MSLPSKDAGEKPSLADLFDLPADAPASVWSEPEDDAYTRAAPVQTTAAPDAANEAVVDVAESGAAGGGRLVLRPRWRWIGVGVLAALVGLALTIQFSIHDAPETEGGDVATPTVPTVAAPVAATEVTPPVAPRAPAVPTDHSALVAARAALRAAEADLAEGRNAAARARLGRLLLAIDAVESLEREGIHAAAALLVARSLQADADAARRAAR